MKRRIRFNFSPDDDGGGTAGEAADPGTGEPAGDTGNPLEGMPKYSSQLSPEAREKYGDLLRGLGADHTITQAFEDFASSRSKLERAILLPEEGNEEDIERFRKEMGIPESAEGYELESGVLGDEVKKIFSDQAMKAGLTKTQAARMWGFLTSTAAAGSKSISETVNRQKESYPQRLEGKVGKEKSEEINNLSTKFLVRLGGSLPAGENGKNPGEQLLKRMEARGSIYDPDFMIAAAQIESMLSDKPFVPGSGPGALPAGGGEKAGTFSGNYSSEFDDMYGGE